jgi:hypothetical protein
MMKRSLAAQSFNYVLLALVVFGFGPRLGAQTMCGGGTGTACVLTWQNDNWRTGQNLNETSITNQASQFPPAPVTIPASTSWLQVGFDAGQTYFNPYESVLNVRNVRKLSLLWQADLGAGEANATAQPLTTYEDIVVAGDIGADPGLSGLDESSGGYV